MDVIEYQKVNNYSYSEYCDYLQQKYGIGLCDYMSQNWTKSQQVSRTSDGLYVHHKYEDRAIKLSHPEYAKRYPYEWQKKENLVYCNLLEHLLLHQLICEYPAVDNSTRVGMGGIVEYIVPELNDVYSGWRSSQKWQQNCHNSIIDHKDVYLLILTRYIDFHDGNPILTNFLLKSQNAKFGSWSNEKNAALYSEILSL